MNIIVCDDDKEIVKAIKIYLENEGLKIYEAYNGVEVIDLMNHHEIHLLIIDIMMPKMNGIETVMKLRSNYKIPIIFLSAKSEDADKVLGLNVGADDYITKPFNPLELIARVKSSLRRYTDLGSINLSKGYYSSGQLIIDDCQKKVSVDGQLIQLTPKQYKILLLLLKNKGQVYSINQIYEHVWEEQAYNVENTVAVHIKNIRDKIEINPKDPKYLKVVWGIGYKIEKH